ncbi:hypothetical protein GCM10020367_26980 [Streptomyces sannanensis]|uniref:HNH endonuclease n=1 Tax=Streptomyces sannanensis TaxID=285536 RepID=A0ABP6SAR8_9ACTN
MAMHIPADLRIGTHDPLRLPPESWRRLYGLACARCGGTESLRPGGHAYTRSADGARLGWAVNVCAACSTQADDRTTNGS